MESFTSACTIADPHGGRRSFARSFLPVASLLFFLFFAAYAFIALDYKEKLSIRGSYKNFIFNNCKDPCRPPGAEFLPAGIVVDKSNLQMRPLWGSPRKNTNSQNLFAMAAGIEQKDLVSKMVKKFLSGKFSVMLFHYDGVVDEWKRYKWSDRVIHVSARNQTKWWFAKRFLHPDIVAEYNYIFVWDEDLGVENFDPQKYLTIIEREGLEISQPALDYGKSKIHQQLTARTRNSFVHRRTFKHGTCDGNSRAPPCTGWVEMMAPVFSKAAWRCAWYMIQNDLIHAWGLDYQLGYCAQGDRTAKIGVVDAEYIVHYGFPTLGGTDENKTTSENGLPPETEHAQAAATTVPPHPHAMDARLEVRRQSSKELKVFQQRWKTAVEEDKCWIDPYQ